MLNAIQPNLICLMRIYDFISVVVSVPRTNQLKIMINYLKNSFKIFASMSGSTNSADLKKIVILASMKTLWMEMPYPNTKHMYIFLINKIIAIPHNVKSLY